MLLAREPREDDPDHDEDAVTSPRGGRRWRRFASLLPAAVLYAETGPIVPSAAPAARPAYVVKEIGQGLYWLSDGAYNTIFLVSSAGVIAVDPLPTLGRGYLEAVASVTAQPITHVVYSHAHTDHIGAAALLPAGGTIIAQKETAAVLARLADPRRPLPSITFDERYVLEVGEQKLVLEYKGPNHCPGNIFIHAPRQKVLMLVDVVYPGYAPYPGLGVAATVPGYIQAHRDALGYDFETFVGGHVDRTGSRADVERSLEFALDLQRTSEEVLAEEPFPAYLSRRGTVDSAWLAHDDYEGERVARCTDRLAPKWQGRLRGLERSLASHCRTMIVAIAIEMPPASGGPATAERD
jgi:glyoxylase-like metal-dependent hydrolase (beta-lactamase superfamily II)